MASDASFPFCDAHPQPPLTLLLHLLMLAGILDAVDLASVSCCSSELYVAACGVWEGVCEKNAATVLRSAARRVDDPAKNKMVFPGYVPLNQAGKCSACAGLTRCRHPVDGSPLCPACGKRAESAPCFSPFARFRMVSEEDARRRFCLSAAVKLDAYLPYAVRPLSTQQVTHARAAHGDGGGDGDGDGEGGGGSSPYGEFDETMVAGTVSRYAPGFAPTIAQAQAATLRPIASAGSPAETLRVYLLRDVACLTLENFGGPRLLQERVCHLGSPLLDPATPDV